MGKLTCISLMTISLAMSIPAFAEIVHVSTPKTSLVLDATKGEPCLLYTSDAADER